MSNHSKYSASGASRWLACPGSVLIEAPESPSSEYAAEGTVAHELACECLLLGVSPRVYLGKDRSADGFTFTVSEEMVKAIEAYLYTIWMEEKRLGPDCLSCYEERIEHTTLPNFGGTVDCYLVSRSERKLVVVDFKYGAGVPVEAEENVQLGSYALLAAMSLGFDPAEASQSLEVRLIIVQPRCYDEESIKVWDVPAGWLVDLYYRVSEVVNGSRNDEIHAGDHCKWCPAKAQCPELYEMTLLTAKQEFSAPSMTVENASKILDKRKSIEAFLDAVENWIHGQLDKGVEVPGYKLVQSLGNRRYAVDEATIEKKCRSKGFGKKQIYETSLLSPAQLEKLVGKELIAQLTERPVKGTTVVPVSDKRPAVKRLTAADEFANLENVET